VSDTIWIYGTHAVEEVLKAGKRKILKVLVTEKNLAKYRNDNVLGKIQNYKLQKLHFKDFAKFLNAEVSHQGIALEIVKPDFYDEFKLLSRAKEVNRIVILDQVTDVGNIGAMIRSMLAFGIKDLVVTEHNSVSEYAHLVKASAGLSEKVNIYRVTNISKLLTKLKDLDFWSAGLDGAARAGVSELKKFEKLILVMGSEGKGIRDLIKKNLDLLVSIPMSEEVESLNVSNAAAITFYSLEN